jgi:hypothetical protein
MGTIRQSRGNAQRTAAVREERVDKMTLPVLISTLVHGATRETLQQVVVVDGEVLIPTRVSRRKVGGEDNAEKREYETTLLPIRTGYYSIKSLLQNSTIIIIFIYFNLML